MKTHEHFVSANEAKKFDIQHAILKYIKYLNHYLVCELQKNQRLRLHKFLINRNTYFA